VVGSRFDSALAAALLAACHVPPPPVAPAAARPDVETAPAHRPSLLGSLRCRTTGEPIAPPANFVVFVRAPFGPPRDARDCLELRQVAGGLQPPLLVVPVGQRVRVVNGDRIFHRWFATADHAPFDTGPLAPGAEFALRFDRPGPVHVHCALHEGRQATVLVIPTPHFAVVGTHGEFELRGLSPGPHELETWGEGLPPQRFRVTVPPSGGTLIEFPVDLPRAGTP
jgi:hypothetical protein